MNKVMELTSQLRSLCYTAETFEKKGGSELHLHLVKSVESWTNLMC